MRNLILLLLLKAAILSLLIGSYEIDLSPDEAQYWTWSQELDLGYYSKPPGIAWQIWSTTFLFGNNAFGVRFGAILIGFLLALAVYQIARTANLDRRICFWSALVMAFSPLGVYLSLAATTDAGAILFITLAVAALLRSNYLLAGFWIFFGALFKWIAFLFWPFALLYLLFFRDARKWSIVWGFLISLLGLLPSLYWNLSHDWATFRHVASTMTAERAGNVFDFLGAQVGLLSPIFFVLLILSYFFRKRNRELLFCSVFPLAVLIYLGMAFFKKMQPNWASYLYPPGMVLIAWVGYPKKVWLHIGTWLSVAIVSVGIAIPWFQTHNLFSIPYKVNPFRQSVGWSELAPVLEKAGYDPATDFLAGDKYQVASLLSFYGPAQKRAYFFNVSDTRRNQFSYWPQMMKGQDGYFVVLENMNKEALPWYEEHYLKRLSPYFKKVEYEGGYPLYVANGEPVKWAILFKCSDYSGEEPASLKEW